jgi:hypothetical protein
MEPCFSGLEEIESIEENIQSTSQIALLKTRLNKIMPPE